MNVEKRNAKLYYDLTQVYLITKNNEILPCPTQAAYSELLRVCKYMWQSRAEEKDHHHVKSMTALSEGGRTCYTIGW